MKNFCVDYSPHKADWTKEDMEILFVRGQRMCPMLLQEAKSSADLSQYKDWFLVRTPAQIRLYG